MIHFCDFRIAECLGKVILAVCWQCFDVVAGIGDDVGIQLVVHGGDVEVSSDGGVQLLLPWTLWRLISSGLAMCFPLLILLIFDHCLHRRRTQGLSVGIPSSVRIKYNATCVFSSPSDTGTWCSSKSISLALRDVPCSCFGRLSRFMSNYSCLGLFITECRPSKSLPTVACHDPCMSALLSRSYSSPYFPQHPSFFENLPIPAFNPQSIRRPLLSVLVSHKNQSPALGPRTSIAFPCPVLRVHLCVRTFLFIVRHSFISLSFVSLALLFSSAYFFLLLDDTLHFPYGSRTSESSFSFSMSV